MEYRERLSAPGWYWLVGVAFGTSGVLALGLWFGPWVGFGAALASVALIGLAVAWMGRTEISVDAAGVRVGPNLLEWPWAGEVTELDAEQTQALLGAASDPSAFVVQRPWLSRAVRVQVADAADPHPYWLLGTRHPRKLAQAIERARTGTPA
ncbi:DUF3093 domain-containing protein [Propioniciclava coleopterorum]|uniref:DUF3093 domain-containing protein n=1 Tax=Propioniciclava coleopterorum TaxID=2714937 RepID=A0A6G7Y9H8_9ACTN|nr:DUF3093 domain-containing protein [Propioniciclava coleopterorum]QIK73430.1 DUF3093 domain-containing protein [Propioniciclava coleopterorum]